jgi:aminocarboxymuconate-semialdehyde decarboxylase
MLFSCSPAAAHGAPLMARRTSGAPKHFTVDIHCHVETPEATELVRGIPHPPESAMVFANDATREVNRRQQETIRTAITSVAARLKHMDRTGIDIQALSTAPGQYYYWAEPDLGRQAARLINDNIARICAEHPDRFVGLATVPLQAPALAIAELERAVKQLGLRGVEICTNVNGEELSAERFRPFFAKAEELGILIFMHP